MPFTFSHPAVVLPFRYIGKKYFSITGLVIGSIIPDFEYFLRVENRSHFSHTWPGVFWFDLPLGIIVCFVFHNIIRGPFIANAPYPLYTRFIRYHSFNWNKYYGNNWLKVMYSIIIGVVTHIIADKITHKSSNLVSSVPGLLETQEFIDSPKSIYRVIQVTFSIIGLALCALTVWQLPTTKQIQDYNPNYRYWSIITGIFSVMLVIIIYKQGYDTTDLIVSTMSSLMAAFLLASLIMLPDKKLYLVR
jgi:hypothetical protein